MTRFSDLQHRVAAGVVLLAASAGLVVAQDSGLYSADQAQQGEILFNNNCAECHRPDLTGAMGPPLKGTAFMQRWGGKPLSELYNFEHNNMPANHPGALSDAVLMPITAFILSKNGVQPGAAPLSADTLKQSLPTGG